jgi:RNA polymerase sigma-70 factor (ECF subfamily)
VDQRAETIGLESNPLSDVVRDERVRRVREAVLTLPIRYREVLVLCELEEKSYQEAASILGCAAGTVRSRLHRARELLVQKLRAEETPAELARAKSRRCPA